MTHTRSASWTRLVRIVLTKLVDQLIRDDSAAPGERLKPIDCLRFLDGVRLLRSRQSTPSQLGNHLSDGLPFAPCPFFRGLQHIVSYIERSPHTSDVSASRITRLLSPDWSKVLRRTNRSRLRVVSRCTGRPRTAETAPATPLHRTSVLQGFQSQFKLMVSL
jgi:hypothetical protein